MQHDKHARATDEAVQGVHPVRDDVRVITDARGAYQAMAYRLAANYTWDGENREQWVIIRPGDRIFTSEQDAALAAELGDDVDQKVGCHLVWESPTFAKSNPIVERMSGRWAK
jgi:hypothetical protein